MSKYRDLVAAAIGLNAERGDQLTHENISFSGEPELVEQPTFLEIQAPLIMQGLRYLIIPIAFFLFYLFFLRPVQKTVFAGWAPAGAPVRALPGRSGDGIQTPMTVRQLEAQLRSAVPPIAGAKGGAPQKDDYANTPERELLPLPSPSKMDVIRERVIEHAQQDPETVARLVRVWLNDEKNK
jgi:flagellar biosynthesis/type III secretory pathway M-ring protein FliF/YscJ